MYKWHGFTYQTLFQTLAWLRQIGSDHGMAERYTLIKDQELEAIIKNAKKGGEDIEKVTSATSSEASPDMSMTYSGVKSVGINTQRFLMLLLAAPQPKTVCLDFATTVLHGTAQPMNQYKTQVR